MKKTLLFTVFASTFLLVSSCSNIALSQDRIVQQNLIWMRYYNRLKISEKTTLHTETEMRRYFFPDRQHQWILPRVHLRKQFSSTFSAGTGITWFLQKLPHSKQVPIEVTRPEIRPHQDFIIKQALGKGTNTQRLRVEQRFVSKVENGELTDSWKFNFRIRYLWQWRVTLWQQDIQKLDLKLVDEVMLNAFGDTGDNIFDQNRISGALSFRLSKQVSTELAYIYWFQQRSSLNRYFKRHIFRLTLSHRMSLVAAAK